jgi:hypothetical protein
MIRAMRFAHSLVDATFSASKSSLELPKVDRTILSFPKWEVLHPMDFTIREDGVVRLYLELTRRVANVAHTGSGSH